MTPRILECHDLRFAYGGHEVLDSVSLSIDEGDFVGVIGPNGSGKSTLIRLLAGVLKPQSGQVVLDGQDVERLSRRSVAKKLAVLAQEESPDFGFTVWQEVMLGRSPHHGGLHFDSRSDRKIVATAMEKARVSHLADRMMAELSGGERQRVRIARGLAQEPRVLFLDEPTNHLDLNSQLALIDLMREINSEGLGILLVSHDINFVGRTCRQIKVLHQKVFLYSGEPHEVITPRNLAEAFGIRAIVDTHPVDGSPRMTPVERLSGPEERTKAERSSNNQNWNTRHSGA